LSCLRQRPATALQSGSSLPLHDQKGSQIVTRIVLAALMLTAAFPATAQDRQALRAACQADFARNCPGIKPGGGRLIACLKEKPDQFSQGCKDALRTAQAQRQGR
jgi:hypothetical protein